MHLQQFATQDTGFATVQQQYRHILMELSALASYWAASGGHSCAGSTPRLHLASVARCRQV